MSSGHATPARAGGRLVNRRLTWALVLAFVWTCGAADLPAQRASVSALTAAFLFSFTAFTEWPPDVMPAQSPLVLCVVGDAEVAQGLEESVKGRDVAGHAMVVRRMAIDGPLRSCQVLYAGGSDARPALAVLDVIKDAPILTVSYASRFEERGGIARLFIEGGRIRFAINLDSTRRARLRLSPQLLSLAKIVKDDPNAVPR